MARCATARSALSLCVGLLGLAGPFDRGTLAAPPNVLFVAVDDLRPELGCYGRTHIRSPHVDRLAQRGTVFERAYCMVSVCGASRASLMSGLRPSRNRFVTYTASAEKEAPGIVTLNTHFRNAGYRTVSLGKVFHLTQDNVAGWSEPPWRPDGVPWYRLPENQALHAQRQKLGPQTRGPAWESADVDDDAYGDGVLAGRAVEDLRRLAKSEQPFFLAVGFLKPHLPFVAPRKYWDLYDPETIRLPTTYHRPKDAPAAAVHASGELRAYAGIPATGPVSDEQARTLIRGYSACVSYTDAQIGRLLDELDRLGLRDKTLVVLWGDHGWNLGEHLMWCKHSCFETSMHAPLIVAAPGIPGGRKTPGLTEFVDVYPSLCELAGLPRPPHLEGTSFVPLMREPDRAWKKTAIGRYVNGDTIRTDRFRYSEYAGPDGRPLGTMLYDHRTDPQEDANVADTPDGRATAAELRKLLHAGMGRDRKFPPP